MKKKIFSVLIAIAVAVTFIPLCAQEANAITKPSKCPKCYKKYKGSYTIVDSLSITKSNPVRYTMWVPVGDPVQNCNTHSDDVYFGSGKSTTVKYEVSGSFSYGNLGLGTKYTKEKTQTTTFQVKVKNVAPRYYAQMYLGTDMDKYKLTCKHSLKCFKCGYVYKKNYKTETSTKAFPLKTQAVKYKTKTAKSAKDVNVKYSSVFFYGCRGCGKGGGGGR